MDEWIRRLHALTQTIANELSDVTYERLMSFQEERDEIIQVMMLQPQNVSRWDRKLLDEVQAWDILIMEKVRQLQDEVLGEIGKLSAHRKQIHAYQDPYSADSYFFDRKK